MKILVYGLFCWIVLFGAVNAKWAPLADAPTQNSYNQEVTVNSDGTVIATEEISKVILTEIGRSQEANVILYYNSDSEEVKLLEAKVIHGGKEYKLDKNLIEDKPLASSYEGFDQSRQILLAFPKTEIGAKIYVRCKFILKKPPLDNFYARIFFFGDRRLTVSERIKINSKLPLHVLVNDPEHYLSVTNNKKNGVSSLEIVLNRPIYKAITNESGQTILNPKKLPWVSVSSLSKWEDFAAKYAELVAKVFTQKLPKDFISILEAAKKKTNDIDKINTVTSLLNDKIKYMGDWRSVSGRLVPSDLDKISKTQLGDCKDFSAVTAAILTQLGFRAQIVATMRGVSNLSLDILPSFQAINHAMVKVTSKQGKVYWVDPTNFESMADGIFPDIAGKMAVILDAKQPRYEKIPEVSSLRAGVNLKRRLEILGNNVILESGDLLLRNECALGLIGSALKVSDDAIRDSVFRALVGGASIEERNKKSLRLPKLNSRVVKDISFDYSLEREHEILQTNVGPALRLTYTGAIPKIYDISTDDVADVLIEESPITLTRQTIIKNVVAKNIGLLNKEIKTPWLSLKRTCSSGPNHDLQINEISTLHKNLIPSEDFKKPEFIALKKWLKDNFKDVIMVFESFESSKV